MLLAALAAERALIAGIDAAGSLPGTDGQILRRIRAEHVAHERALAAAVRAAGGDAYPAGASHSASPGGGPGPSGRPRTGTPPAGGHRPGLPALGAAEAAAARAAARRAARLHGRDAALLASISASEATHAELLA